MALACKAGASPMLARETALKCQFSQAVNVNHRSTLPLPAGEELDMKGT